MDDALFIQILDRIILELNTDRPADVPAANSRRILPGQAVDEDRIAVFLGDEDLDPPRGSSPRDPLARRRMAVAIQCAASTDLIDELDKVVEPLLIWTTSVLGRTRLDGLVHYIRETSVQRRPVYQDLYSMVATQIFECSYQTLRNDITARR